MSDVLRQAIGESGMALIALERETGVQRMALPGSSAGKHPSASTKLTRSPLISGCSFGGQPGKGRRNERKPW
jgi:hypothetical protein